MIHLNDEQQQKHTYTHKSALTSQQIITANFFFLIHNKNKKKLQKILQPHNYIKANYSHRQKKTPTDG